MKDNELNCNLITILEKYWIIWAKTIIKYIIEGTLGEFKASVFRWKKNLPCFKINQKKTPHVEKSWQKFWNTRIKTQL